MKTKLLLFVFLIVQQIGFAQQNNSLFKVNAYQQNPTPDGVTIMWQTNLPCYSWVEYGVDSTTTQMARTIVDGLVVSNNVENKIRINGLQPDTKYYYRICSQEIIKFEPYKKEFGRTEKSAFATFTTLSNKPKDFKCVIYNDLHNKLPLFDILADKVKDINYDFVVFNGDCFTDLQSSTHATDILKHYSEKIGGANTPAYYIRGNHEVRGTFALDLPRIFDRNPYFAFTYGDTRFVILDGGEDKPDTTWVYYNLNDFTGFRNEQTKWLKNEVNSPEFKKAKKHVLIHHMPIYGVEEQYYNPCFDLWNPILQKAAFDVAINAHTHEFTYYRKGEQGNPCPVIIGGGNNEKSAKVMVLEKKNNKLMMKVIDTKGVAVDYLL